MFERKNIREELYTIRQTMRTAEESLIGETQRILNNNLLSDKRILENLGRYNSSFFVIDEEGEDSQYIFTTPEIKKVATHYRLKFLESRHYKPDIPYEAIAKIKRINQKQQKELKQFWVLASGETFKEKNNTPYSLLFVQTNHDNFYLLHGWGEKLHWFRKLKYWPLQRFENLVLCVIFFTLIVTAILPTWAITLDTKATYWSGYRGGVFFHLLIFNSGFTALFAFSFLRNFSNNLWNKKNDLD